MLKMTQTLPSCSPIGGYSILYQLNGNVYCSSCASQHDELTIDNGFIYWEGDSLYCEECNMELESEYTTNEGWDDNE